MSNMDSELNRIVDVGGMKSKQAIITKIKELIEREVIGEDEPETKSSLQIIRAIPIARNTLRAEMRAKLTNKEDKE